MTESTAARKTRAPSAAASPWASVPDRQQQREAKRHAVLQAAAQLFNERGFHATSLDDIAARLNVSKPTLYYYVKNKQELLFLCHSLAFDLGNPGAPTEVTSTRALELTLGVF